MSTVKRTVFYFKDQVPENGVSFYDKIKRVHDLDQSQREFDCDGGNTCNFWYVENDNVIEGTIELIRYISPTIRTRGSNHSSTVSLDQNEGVNEKAHFIYNPTNSVFSFEYNHFGPKIGLLYRAVNRLYKDHFDENTPRSNFAYVSAGTALQRLDESFGIRTVQVRYASPVLSDDEDASSTLSQTINAVREFGNAQTVDILFKGEPHSRGILMGIQQFKARFLPYGDQSLQNFEKLEVKVQKNETGSVELIDLFKDKMLSEITAIRLHEHSRELDTQDFLQKIRRDMRDKGFA